MHEGVMTTIWHFPVRDRVKYRTGPSNLTFIVWATIISIVLILVSIAFGVGIDPEMPMFTSP